MQTDSYPDRTSSASKGNGVAELDWKYPLEMITGALVVMGVSPFFRALSLPDEYVYLLTTVVVLAWRYGVHRAGILRWRWGWRSSLNYSFFSCKQALVNGMAFFVFMLMVFTWTGNKLSLSDASLAALGGLFAGLLGVNARVSASNSRPQSANS
jgi:hypothetical protein